MSSKFNRVADVSNVHFSKAMFGEVERSRMTARPLHLTTFNAGDIIPIYCKEVLPSEELSIDMDFVIRQTTLLTPTMGTMKVDIYAFFVPNRIVNQSWKAVQGENISGSWVANDVSLAPLKVNSVGETEVPIGSLADYYGFPTQKAIPNSVLAQCHDLKFRGYVMIYNEHFRDQNYQPPIPMSTLNVYQGFFDEVEDTVGLNGSGEFFDIEPGSSPDGSFGEGAVLNSLYGSGEPSSLVRIPSASFVNRFRAIGKPLKANKLHDYFTSGLPSPQKSNSAVFAPATGQINMPLQTVVTLNSELVGRYPALNLRDSSSGNEVSGATSLFNFNGLLADDTPPVASASIAHTFYPSNLGVPASTLNVTGLGISVDDLRMAAAVQQTYEIMARGGSRYRELVQSFFGISADDPFSDIPQCLGHISRELDLFQTAQTSASAEDGTPQGNLSAFGYTSSGGKLFKSSFVEHGYVHILAVVRHRNVYASYLGRDNFRLNQLDFYLPPLANISEQPVYLKQINPFASNPDDVFAYQEAWAEYRYEPDIVTGMMRPQPTGTESLALWNYADNFDDSIAVLNGTWLKSNSEEVLNRTLAVDSSQAPQFRAAFRFSVEKELPMPTYSVPGMDII